VGCQLDKFASGIGVAEVFPKVEETFMTLFVKVDVYDIANYIWVVAFYYVGE
jgi:hypothetical protein